MMRSLSQLKSGGPWPPVVEGPVITLSPRGSLSKVMQNDRVTLENTFITHKRFILLLPFVVFVLDEQLKATIVCYHFLHLAPVINDTKLTLIVNQM